MSRAVAALTLVGCLALVGPMVRRPPLTLLWNTTASAPEGLYSVSPAAALHAGDMVIVQPPPPLAGWLAQRGYVPSGVPLLKAVAALQPSIVCRRGPTVTIDDLPVGLASPRDRRGRRLPIWGGCRRLTAADVFVLNRADGSLDSRYFGPLPRSAIIGRATPLWLRGDR